MDFDPEVAAALAANPAIAQQLPLPPPDAFDVVNTRKLLGGAVFNPFMQYYAEILPEASEYIMSDKLIAVDGGEIRVRYVKPTGEAGETFPVLVWLHGGGWVVGSLENDDTHFRSISVDLKLAVASIGYRLSPECKFPVPFEDSYTGLKWVAEHAAELGIDLKKGFLVGGDSAGGNLAAGVALKARDDPFFAGRPLTGQYLREPVIAAHPDIVPEQYKDELRSFKGFASTPILNTTSMLWFSSVYAPEGSDIRASPLLATSHAGLPPAFFQIQELDPLHDEGKLYEKLLREAGVPTKLIENKGCFHAFHYCFPGVAPAVKLDRDARDGLRWLLAQS